MKRLTFVKNLGIVAASIFLVDTYKKNDSDSDRLEKMLNSGQPVINQKFILDRDIVIKNKLIHIEQCTIDSAFQGRIIKLSLENCRLEIHYSHFIKIEVISDKMTCRNAGSITHNWFEKSRVMSYAVLA